MSQSRQPSPHYTNVQQVCRLTVEFCHRQILQTQYANTQLRLSQLAALRGMHPDVIRRMIDNISFIAEHYRAQEAEDKVGFGGKFENVLSFISRSQKTGHTWRWLLIDCS